MSNENYEKLERSINNMRNKLSRIYFLVQDTKGNAKASIKYIYHMLINIKLINLCIYLKLFKNVYQLKKK